MSLERLQMEQRMRQIEEGGIAGECLDLLREMAEAFASAFIRMDSSGRRLPPCKSTLSRKAKDASRKKGAA